MKGKLITDGKNNYSLLDYNNELIGTTMESMITNQKLSLKNCDEIFGVVDVDKLGQKHYEVHIKRGHTQEDSLQRKIDFIIGFNKAMELNKDKVFTLEQMSVAYNTNRSGTLFEQLINSFGGQPTEIEVEIEMICPHPMDTYRCGLQYGCDGDGCNHPNQIPYLDSEGCLVLKRVV
jgi:hypothetical protein